MRKKQANRYKNNDNYTKGIGKRSHFTFVNIVIFVITITIIFVYFKLR